MRKRFRGMRRTGILEISRTGPSGFFFGMRNRGQDDPGHQQKHQSVFRCKATKHHIGNQHADGQGRRGFNGSKGAQTKLKQDARHHTRRHPFGNDAHKRIEGAGNTNDKDNQLKCKLQVSLRH